MTVASLRSTPTSVETLVGAEDFPISAGKIALCGSCGARFRSIPVVLDPKVFKAYDVRGVYPAELDEDGAYAIGRAYVEQFEPRTIAVGRDMRLSSPSMAAAVIDAAADAGADVVDIGMVGTEMLYFAVDHLGLDGGIAVTASHNPKDYTGMKIVRRGALPVGGDSGLFDIRDRALSLTGTVPVKRRGTVTQEDVYPAFVERVLSFVDVDAIKPLKVVIDAANGMAGVMLPPILERLPLRTERYFFEPDGTFPNHEPNPLLPENREFIVRTTLEEGADLGVAYDGDADRCFFVDDTGEFVPGDFVTALLAESIIEKEPGGKVIYDVRASWAVPETIERAGGVPLLNRVGHAFFKHRMREDGAVFGGEVSAHYYFRDFSQADSGVVPFLLMVELLCKRGKPLSKLLRPYRERYFLTGEINTPVADVAVKLQELKERFGPEGRVSHLDGVSVDAEDWHMNVRPSNTEPLLRLNLEARSQELMERKRDEVLEVIRGAVRAAS
jgi:phosphomannomutase